ncbi:hypothetical protein V6R21_24505 [Limibacter armeniacum]|uniref:hypothetical protein n=1 Tax=Limibacter armeniacum TaxID=466084 RepID=UPI002FE6B52A
MKNITRTKSQNTVKYYEGSPKQYRADCKAGQFNLNGIEPLGNQLTFQPVAWRFFTDEILGMDRRKWVELFFVDAEGCLSALLFHGYSRENLEGLAAKLFYSEVTMAEIILHCSLSEKKNEKANAKYFIAEFDFEVADTEATKKLKAATARMKLYRTETITGTCQLEAFYRYEITKIEAAREELNRLNP